MSTPSTPDNRPAQGKQAPTPTNPASQEGKTRLITPEEHADPYTIPEGFLWSKGWNGWYHTKTFTRSGPDIKEATHWHPNQPEAPTATPQDSVGASAIDDPRRVPVESGPASDSANAHPQGQAQQVPEWALLAIRALSEYTEHSRSLDRTYAAIIASHAPAVQPTEAGKTKFELECEKQGLSKAEMKDLPRLYRWQKESLAAFRAKFGASSNCEALDAIDRLLSAQPAKSATPNAESIYRTALERIAGNEADTNREKADGIAIVALEAAKSTTSIVKGETFSDSSLGNQKRKEFAAQFDAAKSAGGADDSIVCYAPTTGVRTHHKRNEDGTFNRTPWKTEYPT